mmetsp:Transcript_21174/g.55147  ORF Transcript_21174/g.55147 Transcript_21174/m.55147 type:complete len:223 (-) Transcript_21174:5693-6361(-)
MHLICGIVGFSVRRIATHVIDGVARFFANNSVARAISVAESVVSTVCLPAKGILTDVGVSRLASGAVVLHLFRLKVERVHLMKLAIRGIWAKTHARAIGSQIHVLLRHVVVDEIIEVFLGGRGIALGGLDLRTHINRTLNKDVRHRLFNEINNVVQDHVVDLVLVDLFGRKAVTNYAQLTKDTANRAGDGEDGIDIFKSGIIESKELVAKVQAVKRNAPPEF